MFRQFQRDGRETFTRGERIAERRTLRERIMAPAGPNCKTKYMRNFQSIVGQPNDNISIWFQLLLSEKAHWPLALRSALVPCASMAWASAVINRPS